MLFAMKAEFKCFPIFVASREESAESFSGH